MQYIFTGKHNNENDFSFHCIVTKGDYAQERSYEF